MPALLLFNIWISLPVILYMKVNRASLWNRWDEVLRRTEILCRLQRFHTAKYFPDYEFPRLRAVALAGKGQVDAALAEMKHLESDPGCERCIYYSELAFVCELSKQVDQSIELTQRAIQEKPLPVFHLQLASRYLRLKKDLARARAAFERVDKDTLLHDQHSSYHLVRGALDFRDGNFVAARAEMETALALQASAPPSPASEVLMLIIKAALSRVIARQGDLATAARYFDEAEAYLIAIKDIENLQECRQLLGRA